MTAPGSTPDPLAWATPGADVAHVDDAHPGPVEHRTVARVTRWAVVTSDGERWRRGALQAAGPWAGSLAVLSGTRAKRLASWDHPRVLELLAAGAAPADDPAAPAAPPRLSDADEALADDPAGARRAEREPGGVPWGRRPVASIPVPPFGSHDEHRAFVEALALWVAELSTTAAGPSTRPGVGPSTGPGVGPGVGLGRLALLGLLDAERTRLRSPRGPVEPQPAPSVLRVAVLTLFPAPWTPTALADALAAADARAGGGGRPADGVPTTRAPDLLVWGDDPVLTARRTPDGSWTVERSGRGRADEVAQPWDDDDLVLLLMGAQRGVPYPLGRRTDALLRDALAAAARPTLDAWAEHATLPGLAEQEHR